MRSRGKKLVGFYNSNAPYYEFTNFGFGHCYNRFGGGANFSEIAFQAAKLPYLTTLLSAQRLQQLTNDYFTTVKSPRNAFDFMRKPRPELGLGNFSINELVAPGWHAFDPHFGVTYKELEMAFCLATKFDASNPNGLFIKLTQSVAHGEILVEESPDDAYWGWGYQKDNRGNELKNRPGKNALGLMLTALGRTSTQPDYQTLSPQDKVMRMLTEYKSLTLEFNGYDFHQRLPKVNDKHGAPHAAMFPQAKPKPASQEIVNANNQIVQEVMAKAKAADASFHGNKKFIVRKGNIKGTFKMAFDNAESAKEFLAHLNRGGFAKNVTYYGDKEKYPMDQHGRVGKGGKYKYVLRFEIPEKALQYMQALRVKQSEGLYNVIMEKAPAPQRKLSAVERLLS